MSFRFIDCGRSVVRSELDFSCKIKLIPHRAIVYSSCIVTLELGIEKLRGHAMSIHTWSQCKFLWRPVLNKFYQISASIGQVKLEFTWLTWLSRLNKHNGSVISWRDNEIGFLHKRSDLMTKKCIIHIEIFTVAFREVFNVVDHVQILLLRLMHTWKIVLYKKCL